MSTEKGLLGARIKEIRKGKGLSQEQLSEKIDIDVKHLSRIEVGANFPSLGTLVKLSEALSVELKDFFELTHLTDNPKELRATISSLLKEAQEDQLKVIVKVLRAIIR